MYSRGSGHITTCANLNFVGNALSPEVWLPCLSDNSALVGEIEDVPAPTLGHFFSQTLFTIGTSGHSIPWPALVLFLLLIAHG